MAVAAPVIAAEMAVWTALGGRNSGIVPDSNHGSGFHMAAEDIPAGDYSRRRDPAGPNAPVNWSWACAGDFWHGGDETLRGHHRAVLARLMAGELPMICEYIGKPWADRPVYYWARWNGISVLQRYTGSGHDTWSHISWYRSRADQPAGLWGPAEGTNMLCKRGDKGPVVEALQRLLQAVGHSPGKIDADYGPGTAAALLAARKEVGTQAANGDQYSAAAYVQLLQLLSRRHAGQPGRNGTNGTNGAPGVVDYGRLVDELLGRLATTPGQARE